VLSVSVVSRFQVSNHRGTETQRQPQRRLSNSELEACKLRETPQPLLSRAAGSAMNRDWRSRNESHHRRCNASLHDRRTRSNHHPSRRVLDGLSTPRRTNVLSRVFIDEFAIGRFAITNRLFDPSSSLRTSAPRSWMTRVSNHPEHQSQAVSWFRRDAYCEGCRENRHVLSSSNRSRVGRTSRAPRTRRQAFHLGQ